MLFLLFTLSAVSGTFLEDFPSYSDLLSSLHSYASSGKASLETIGHSAKGRHIKALYIDMKKPFDCLVVGGLQGNGHLISLEIIKLIESSLSSFLQFNIWFVPVLNIDSFLKVEEFYTRESELMDISKNQKDTGCFTVAHRGVDLDRNFLTSCFDDADECDKHYQGTSPFSESETQAIQHLVENQPIELIIGYFTGGFYYSSYNKKLLKRLGLDNFYLNECGSLENYAKSKDVLSVLSYISDEPYPSEIESVTVEPMFFRILEEVAPHFIYSKEKDEGEIKIHVTNIGFITAENIIVSIEASEVISYSDIQVSHASVIEQYYKENLKTVMLLKISKLEAFGTTEVLIDYECESDVNFHIQIKDYDAEEIPFITNNLTYQQVFDLRILVACATVASICFLLLPFYYLCRQSTTKPKFIKVPNRSASLKDVSEDN